MNIIESQSLRNGADAAMLEHNKSKKRTSDEVEANEACKSNKRSCVVVDLTKRSKRSNNNYGLMQKQCIKFLDENFILDNIDQYFDIKEMKDLVSSMNESTVGVWINNMLNVNIMGECSGIDDPYFDKFSNSIWTYYNRNFLSKWDGEYAYNPTAMRYALTRRSPKTAKAICDIIKNSD